MTDTIDVLTDKQKAKIRVLARQGCSINEVGTALGFTQGTIAQILEDENHPFNTTYWQAKVRYARQLRDLAMNLAKTSEDDAVRAKILDFWQRKTAKPLRISGYIRATPTSGNWFRWCGNNEIIVLTAGEPKK